MYMTDKGREKMKQFNRFINEEMASSSCKL